MSNNWSEFKLRVNTTASVEKAYKAVATPGGLESWFLRDMFGESIGFGDGFGQEGMIGKVECRAG